MQARETPTASAARTKPRSLRHRSRIPSAHWNFCAPFTPSTRVWLAPSTWWTFVGGSWPVWRPERRLHVVGSQGPGMRDLLSSDTVVVGVGNTILSDDGAGVTILDGGTLVLEPMPYISDASRVPRADGVFTSWELPI